MGRWGNKQIEESNCHCHSLGFWNKTHSAFHCPQCERLNNQRLSFFFFCKETGTSSNAERSAKSTMATSVERHNLSIWYSNERRGGGLLLSSRFFPAMTKMDPSKQNGPVIFVFCVSPSTNTRSRVFSHRSLASFTRDSVNEKRNLHVPQQHTNTRVNSLSKTPQH